MSVDPKLSRSLRDVTGFAVSTWAIIAFLNLVTQAVLYYEMASTKSGAIVPGEFGLFNAALALIGLLIVPLLALQQALRLFFFRPQDTRLDLLRASTVTIVETSAWLWGGVCFVLIFLPLPLPYLPRFSLQLLVLLNVFLALGGALGLFLLEQSDRWSRVALILIGAALVRAVLIGSLTAYQPWAETALCAFLVAGFIPLLPALQPREMAFAARLKACASLLDRGFLTHFAATLSVAWGTYLFINGDRMATLSWADATVRNGVLAGTVSPEQFDRYQMTGLLARGLLWGTQPLLWLLYVERAPLSKTTPASLQSFWIYLAALLTGALAIGLLSQRWALGGIWPGIATYGPTFAGMILPLGLLQGLGLFSLASRRYPECHVLGGCGVVYALVLAWFGRRPDLMLPYMFGLALISLMILLFVGIVRWGRRQP